MTSEILPSVADFYINASLYAAYTATTQYKEQVFNVIYYRGTIDCYCPGCGQKSVFRGEDNRPKQYSEHMSGYPASDAKSWQTDLSRASFLINKEFKCTRDVNHSLIFYLKIHNETLQKIGQFPSVADLNSFGITKFRKILGAELYSEFNRAIGLFSHDVGVGSFVYLRRIIENFIISPAYEKAKLDIDWDDKAYNKLRVSEKINKLKAFLPDFLVQNSDLYSIISKGIHELTEMECKIYFPVLRESMEYVLTELQAQKETEQKKQELTRMISKIAGELK